MNAFFGQIKAIAGAAVGFILYIVGTVQSGGAIIPSVDPFDKWGWAWFFGSALLGYLGVYGVPANRLKPEALQKQLLGLPNHAQAAVTAQSLVALPTAQQAALTAESLASLPPSQAAAAVHAANIINQPDTDLPPTTE